MSKFNKSNHCASPNNFRLYFRLCPFNLKRQTDSFENIVSVINFSKPFIVQIVSKNTSLLILILLIQIGL